jgi:predicted CopG family antitoxin
MGSTTITISDEAYKILKAQKREGESFSDVIMRTFSRGHPSRILAAFQDREPLDDETADNIRKVRQDLRRNLKLRVQEL